MNINLKSCEYHALLNKIGSIRISLDHLEKQLELTQYTVTRDFGDRTRDVYDGVINDVNKLRKEVNVIGTCLEPVSKFRSWIPLMPLRKEIIPCAFRNDNVFASYSLRTSRSLNFVDLDDYGIGNLCAVSVDNLTGDRPKLSSRRRSCRRNVSNCVGGSKENCSLVHLSSRSSIPRSNLNSCSVSDADCNKEVRENETASLRLVGNKYKPEASISCDGVKQNILQLHNSYRSKHGCPELRFKECLTNEAQNWADTLSLKGYIQYSDMQDRGETIALVEALDSLTGSQICDQWYQEGIRYNYKKPKWRKETSGFTQMVWKNSSFAGVGIAKFPYTDTHVIVVQYQPPGNINTEESFRNNVPPLVY